jgi:hypothetical protein
MSDEEPKLIAIDEEAYHQIMHGDRFGVPGVTAGKFTLGHYDPRSNGDQPRVLNTSTDPPNCP